MISQQDIEALEKLPFDERIPRVEKLLEGKEKPRPFELGLLLALKMGKEIREGKAPGTDTSKLVLEWTKNYPESVVDEAIANAREFLIHPANIAEKIREGLLRKDKVAEDAGTK